VGPPLMLPNADEGRKAGLAELTFRNVSSATVLLMPSQPRLGNKTPATGAGKASTSHGSRGGRLVGTRICHLGPRTISGYTLSRRYCRRRIRLRRRAGFCTRCDVMPGRILSSKPSISPKRHDSLDKNLSKNILRKTLNCLY
jgi:hypothetical protein